ncbi:HAD-IIB family hydrolase [Aliishimia ponticola]|uniref:HAD-IIB family hydrolase n=1 Tax=Aliishimia ponticola TaxID=2499833 RepID=A0A4V3XK24_9RHOB|nr:HAD-IIB family hydrolase [Aliishimia ponticola]THH35303.1 HAD-IIB family hydrolase [Aliishimia ponticola]
MAPVFFTDLDGTLLDHDTYSHAPARDALAALRDRGIPLVLTSSKTAAEIAELHRDLDLGTTPAIVENGAGIFDPQEGLQGDRGAHRKVLTALDQLPSPLRAGFTGFTDMTVEEVQILTGLDAEASRRAKMRCHSEPGLWTGPQDTQDAFIAGLAQHGIAARQGGRFLTLSLGHTKADAMATVAQHLGATLTVALGDAPNDFEMLDAADIAVVIRNDHGPDVAPLRGEGSPRVHRTTEPGPRGWNTAVLAILEDITARGRE